MSAGISSARSALLTFSTLGRLQKLLPAKGWNLLIGFLFLGGQEEGTLPGEM